MATLQQQLDAHYRKFQNDVATTISKHAKTLVANTLQATKATLKNGNGAKKGATPSVGSDAAVAKRSPEAIEKLKGAFVAYVAKHPGQRIEVINKAVKASTKDLRLPIEKAIAEGLIKVKGEKRATEYYAK